MGAGKTTIGRHLARELGVAFVDTDELIAQRHGPIPELFARIGESGFREAELGAVHEALSAEPRIIALGGGAVTYAATRALLSERTLRVYLSVPVEALVARLQRSRTQRPVVGSLPTAERVAELLALREPLYLESDIVVHGPRRSKRAFALEIVARVRAHQSGLESRGYGWSAAAKPERLP